MQLGAFTCFLYYKSVDMFYSVKKIHSFDRCSTVHYVVNKHGSTFTEH